MLRKLTAGRLLKPFRKVEVGSRDAKSELIQEEREVNQVPPRTNEGQTVVEKRRLAHYVKNKWAVDDRLIFDCITFAAL
jgi:hypothetical protein